MINKKFLFSWLILGTVFLFFFKPLPEKGVIPGEPDEFIYAKVAKDLGLSFPPYYSGAPFIVEPPLFSYLVAPLIKLTGEPLFSARLVSFVLVLATSFAIFWYLYDKFKSYSIAILAAMFFLFNPLTVFYSQVGILEPTLSFFLFLFFVFLERAINSGRFRFFLLSALTSLLSILTKYTGLFTIPILFLIFFLRTLVLNVKRRVELNKDYLFLDYKSLLTFLIPAVSSLALLFYLSRRFPLEFRWQVAEVLGFNGSASFNLASNLRAGLIQSLANSFSLPFLLLVIAGLLSTVFSLRTFGAVAGMSIVLSVIVFSRLPFYFRYLVILTPFFAVLAAVPFFVYKFSLRLGWPIFFVVTFLYLTSTFNSLTLAYRSSKHNLLEEAVSYVNSGDPGRSAWLFSNYWPNILSDIGGRKNIGWLTFDNREISIFAPSETRTGKEIMEKVSTYVVIEDYFSKRQIIANAPRAEAYEYIVSNYKPVITIADENPNFPFTLSSNRISIYHLQR